MNWIVKTYDENDNITESFVIENRTEQQAEKEAMHSPEVRASADWTIKQGQDILSTHERTPS
jgi:hypothetical protein